MKTKVLISAVAVGNLVGEVVTFLGGPANTTGWDVTKFPCECAWGVLALPLGWLGMIAGRFSYSPGIFHLCLWGGITLNACLWGWVAYRVIRAVRGGQGGDGGFEVSILLPRLAELRRNHVLLAHSRAKPLQFRKGLLAAAGRALAKFAYFSPAATEPEKPEKLETPKNAP